MRRPSLTFWIAASALHSFACQQEPPKPPPNNDWYGFEEQPAIAEEAPEVEEPPREVPVQLGGKPPKGYVAIERTPWPLAVLGSAVFAVAYVPAALHSTTLDGNAWTMQVPVVGPFMHIGATVEHFVQNGPPEFGLFGYMAVGIYFVPFAALGAAQAGGVVLTIVGLVTKEPHWVRSDLALIDTPALRLTPRFVGNGFELRGTF